MADIHLSIQAYVECGACGRVHRSTLGAFSSIVATVSEFVAAALHLGWRFHDEALCPDCASRAVARPPSSS